MRLTAIAAIDLAYGLGLRGTIPWRLPSDLRRFKSITLGHPVVMGRITWQSLRAPLVGRTNIVLSRDTTFIADGAAVVHSLDEALKVARGTVAGDDLEVMILGGGVIFAEALPLCTRLHLSVVGNVYPCDTVFPRAWGEGWTAVRSEAVPADEKHSDAHLYVLLERAEPR